MADRPDTGAREPQDSAAIERDVVAVRGKIDYPESFDYIASVEALDRLAALAHRALAAGVGVPPAKDSVAQSAENADVRARDEFVLRLRWTCQACGWEHVVDAPGFAGDGHLHYPDGTHGCGPITAQKADGYPPPRDATPLEAS